MSAAYYPQVQKIYVAYYGRPADPAGLQYWAGRLAATNGNLSSIIDAFGNSSESTALYAGATNSAKVTAIYQQLFNRAPDAAGLAFYTGELTAGRMTAASIALNVANGAQGTDLTYLNNKVTVATAFSDQLTTDAAAAVAYTGTTAITAARALITGVTTSAATTNVASTITSIKSGSTTAVAGQPFTLTIDADEVAGKATNDSIRATINTSESLSTLTGDDVIDGGDGTDTLTVFLNGTVTAITEAPYVTNVEVLEVRAAAAATLDLSGATLSGLEEIAIVRARDTVDLTVDDLSGVSLRLESVSDQAISVTANDANDTTLAVAVTSSDTVALTIAEADDIDTLELSINGDSELTLALADDNTVTTVDISGEGDLELIFAGTALTSIDASLLKGGLTFDGSAVAEDLTIVGGTGDDAVTGGSAANVFTGNGGDDSFVASTTGDIEFSGGTGDDTLDLSALAAAAGDFDDSSFDGGLGSDTIIIDAAALTTDALADAGDFAGFEVLEIGAGGLTGFDFADYTSVTELVVGTGATAATGDIDNADNKTITLLGAAATLTITDDTSSDVVVVNIDSADAAITAADITAEEIEDITVNVTAGGTSNAITVASLAITGADTVEINIADASDSGATVTVTAMTVDSGDVVLNLDAADAVITAADLTGAGSVTINANEDNVEITALTTDAADVVIDLAGSTNVIGAADLSGVETLVITTSGDSNEITTLTADSLVDITLDITGGDFAVSLASTADVLETITITGGGEVTSVVVAASDAMTLLDLSSFTGTVAASGIDLSALTVGIDIEVGELTGATAATTSGQILLAANTLRDTIILNENFDGFLMIDGFDGGAFATDDLIDLTALGVRWADLDIADDGTDTEITSDEFDFTIVLTGVTAGDVSQLNFSF